MKRGLQGRDPMREKQAIHKKQDEKLYRDFRKHLDRQSMGFPAIRSGAKMRLLKRIFTPEEVRIAMHLSYKPKSFDEIRAGIRDDPSSRRDLEHALDTMIEKGGIGHQERQGTASTSSSHSWSACMRDSCTA